MENKLRLSGLLWSHFGGKPDKWDDLAEMLIRRTTSSRKQAMALYYTSGLPLDLAEKVWTFLGGSNGPAAT